MSTFATFSPGFPNNSPTIALPVFGPVRVGPLGVWSPLAHWLLVLLPQVVAWLSCCHAMQERFPKRWALSYHCLTRPFGPTGLRFLCIESSWWYFILVSWQTSHCRLAELLHGINSILHARGFREPGEWGPKRHLWIVLLLGMNNVAIKEVHEVGFCRPWSSSTSPQCSIVYRPLFATL